MAGLPTSQQRSSSGEGFFEHSRAMLAALSEYLHARLRLAGIETKEAFVHYGLAVALVVGALVVVVFGYLFLCIGITVLIAHFLEISAGWPILIMALLHFAVAVVCVLIARAKLMTPTFTGTIAEFKKDQQWLNSSNTSNPS